MSSQVIYCYETKQKFESIKEASRFFNLKNPSPIYESLNVPNKTSRGYHWCTDLSVFNNIELTGGLGKYIYCYEIRKKFISIADAAKAIGLKSKSSIRGVMNNPNKTSAGYHWCTDLSIFDNEKLTDGSGIYLYCYETKKQFKSVKEAARFVGLKDEGSVKRALDNPNKTAADYHWCSDLSIFDDIDFTKIIPSYQSKPEFEIKEFIESFGLEVLHGNRKIIHPYELDLVIPGLNLAIEYNGNFWHDDTKRVLYGFKPCTPRELKTKLCEEKNIKLFHIEENDFRNNKKEIFDMIKNLIVID